MYGYIVVNQPELKFKEYAVYRSYYCGLCDALKDAYGIKGQISISYDMTFLVMLLTGLYEPETKYTEERCIAHPVRKHPVRRNAVTDYVADMNVLLTYYKCMDDWNDERKILKRTFAGALKGKVRQLEKKYSEKADIIRQCMTELSELEKAGETNIDKPAQQFGRLLAEVSVMKEDEWSRDLRILGDNLGRFIYLLDAYDDLDKDEKKNNYNVFRYHKDQKDFDAFCESILRAYMAGCARQFERLPILDNAQILRNIIYSGVWTRFEIARARRNNTATKQVEDHNDRSI
ncbi:MAG: DUF5685 family protein [Lachnospira sp.]